MEFLYIDFKKYSSLLLHAIHSPFSRRILKKPDSSLVFKNPYNKIHQTGQLKSIHE